MVRRSSLVFAAALVLAGCSHGPKQEAVYYDDTRNPHYQQAQQDLDAGNAAAAATDYEAALAEDAKLAQANYELGLLYGDKLNDPVSSIYHFKRYLDLDPGSDRVEQVKAQIDKQSQAFAASVSNASAGSGDLAQLQADNGALKKQLADAGRTISKLQVQLAQAMKHHPHAAMAGPAPAASGPPPAPVPAPAPMLADTTASNAPPAGPAADGAGTPPPTPTNVAPATPPRAVAVDTNAPDVNAVAPAAGTNDATAAPSGPARTYTVVKGDSLWRIAHKMYPGDTKNGEEKIRDANKDAMSGKFLKPGQVLIIP